MKDWNHGRCCGQEECGSHGFVLGMLLGLGLGGALGLVFAPTPREKRKLKRVTKGQMEDLLEQMKESLQMD